MSSDWGTYVGEGKCGQSFDGEACKEERENTVGMEPEGLA